MKFFIQIIFILIIFFKTGNLLSSENLFSVNNIVLEKKDGYSSKQLADKAIKEGFGRLTKRILLNQDNSKISDLTFPNIKELVAYYNISKNLEGDKNNVSFNITFDKDKLYDLFYKKKILYSDISDKEFYILPILIKENNAFIFSNNFFYENWNKTTNNELIEFILPLQNIEIIQNISQSRNNLFELELNSLFKEYKNKNVAIILIDNNQDNINQIYIKTRIQDKTISRSLKLNKIDPNKFEINKKIILAVKNEIINLIKSQNLIDVSTPSFLNARLNLNKKINLVLLNSKIKKISLIENIFVQEFNKNYVSLRIKYLGNLEKVIKQLKDNDVNLQIINNEWILKTL